MTGRAPGLVILFYHRVNPDGDAFFPALDPETFDWQMRFLAERFAVVPLEALADGTAASNGRPMVALTFDDGHHDVYRHAYPTLRRHGFPATVFLVSDCLVDGSYLWADRISYALKYSSATRLRLTTPVPVDLSLESPMTRWAAATRLKTLLKAMPDEGRREALDRLVATLGVSDFGGLRGTMLGRSEIEEMRGHGITFGSHTQTHPILTRMSLDAAEAEIAGSRARLEAALDAPVTAFCYPNGLAGDVNDDLKALVERAGYRLACTSVFGVNTPPADRFALKRITFTRRVLGTLPFRLLGEFRRLLPSTAPAGT
jgi:peptidoglycan/xylan/chitin deacetylase (PgdA/CDA1 family)